MARYENHERGVAEPLWEPGPDVGLVEGQALVRRHRRRPTTPKPVSEPHLSRHERREAGRERHHRTGEPAWEAHDRVGQAGGDATNPDAAPEILGGG